jgi:hypothetical protein
MKDSRTKIENKDGNSFYDVMSSYLIVIIWESVFYIIRDNDDGDDDDDFYDYTLPWLYFILTSRLLRGLQFGEKLYCDGCLCIEGRDIKRWHKSFMIEYQALAEDIMEIDRKSFKLMELSHGRINFLWINF